MNILDGISEKVLDAFGLKAEKILNKSRDKTQKVQVVQEQVTFVDSKITRITTTKTLKQDSPDFTVENPLQKDVKIKRISIIPGAVFKTKGRLVVTVNDVVIFSDTKVADWTDVSIFEIPLDVETQILRRGESIEFFIWTPDATSVNLTLTYVIAS